MAVHYIDVDQGASALVEFPCGAILIDAGGRGQAAGYHLIAYLDAFFQRRPELNRTIAALFVTYPHIDHMENLQRVVERYRVAQYITDEVPAKRPADLPAAWINNRVATGRPRSPPLRSVRRWPKLLASRDIATEWSMPLRAQSIPTFMC